MLKNLINERKKTGLTQKELAVTLGITERHYQSIEAGTSDGSVALWKALSKMFNCTIDYLLEQVVENHLIK